jgi:hypothetical protein
VSTALSSRRSYTLPLIVAAWVLVVSAAIVWTWHYKTTPGLASRPPAAWPASAELPSSRMTLVVALHPLCTCSEATISELARLMSSIEERPAVYALFYDYQPAVKPVSTTSLWRRAAAIPGVTALRDRDGAMAKSFGAETSGDVIAYASDGRLVFHGGVTAARGHEGDSFGRQRLLAVLRGQTPDRRDSPVFGCNLEELTKAAL